MDASLWPLFISAFISSTLFPGGSEVVLGYLASATKFSPIVLVCVAGIGNTLGGMSSWLIGRVIAIRYSTRDVLKQKHQTAIKQMQKWGSPILLLTWLPIVGDPLCVAAGWLRIHWTYALVFIALGKFARYAIILIVIRESNL